MNSNRNEAEAGQAQVKPYDAGNGTPAQAAYTGPRKLAGVKNLLDGVDNLVNKGNLASSYKQQGGQ